MGSFIARVRDHLCSSKTVKGQALADFLANHPIPDDWKFSEDLPDEGIFFIELPCSWQMFFDGAARCNGAGAGIVFVSPEGEVMPFALNLK